MHSARLPGALAPISDLKAQSASFEVGWALCFKSYVGNTCSRIFFPLTFPTRRSSTSFSSLSFGGANMESAIDVCRETRCKLHPTQRRQWFVIELERFRAAFHAVFGRARHGRLIVPAHMMSPSMLGPRPVFGNRVVVVYRRRPSLACPLEATALFVISTSRP